MHQDTFYLYVSNDMCAWYLALVWHVPNTFSTDRANFEQFHQNARNVLENKGIGHFNSSTSSFSSFSSFLTFSVPEATARALAYTRVVVYVYRTPYTVYQTVHQTGVCLVYVYADSVNGVRTPDVNQKYTKIRLDLRFVDW